MQINRLTRVFLLCFRALKSHPKAQKRPNRKTVQSPLWHWRRVPSSPVSLWPVVVKQGHLAPNPSGLGSGLQVGRAGPGGGGGGAALSLWLCSVAELGTSHHQ